MKAVYILLSILAGSVLPFQAAINGRLGNTIGSPLYASLLSFLIGSIGLFLYGLVNEGSFKIDNLRQVHLDELTGGLLGAFYVLVVILMLPRLGAALTFSLVVAGQMVVALLLDHTGLLVQVQHPVNQWRILGLLFIIGGVILIRKF
jgi:bacterial/archaeal transporter family-2 protein